MAHPSNAFSTNTYLIAADVIADGETVAQTTYGASNGGAFHAITCTVAGTVKVRGGGLYKFVDVSDATDVHQNFINPATGAPFISDAVMNAALDGFYESIDSIDVSVVMIAGQSIYGKFASVLSDGTFTGFAYN